MKLDDKGRCCGRKPLTYKRTRVYFCARCDREYSMETGEQVENWSWQKINGEFVKVRG